MATPATFKCCIPKPRTRENKERAEVCYESSRLPRAMHTPTIVHRHNTTLQHPVSCVQREAVYAEPGHCREHARVRPRHVLQRSVDCVDRILCIDSVDTVVQIINGNVVDSLGSVDSGISVDK